MQAPISRQRRGTRWCQLEKMDPHTNHVPQVHAVGCIAGVHLCQRHLMLALTTARLTAPPPGSYLLRAHDDGHLA